MSYDENTYSTGFNLNNNCFLIGTGNDNAPHCYGVEGSELDFERYLSEDQIDVSEWSDSCFFDGTNLEEACAHRLTLYLNAG